MKKIIFEFIIIILLITLLFKYNIQIKYNLELVLLSFVKNIIPSMFPIIFITNYIKYNILNTLHNKYIRYISLLFSFAPSNAIICASKDELLYSSVINPLYSYTVLSNYFCFSKVLYIIIINMLFNYIFLFKNISNNHVYLFTKKSFTYIIKETTMTIINILGVVIFFNILIVLLNIIISSKALFFFEITNGFLVLDTLNNLLLKRVLVVFLNSFGGLAIFFQIKSINNDASYKLLINKIVLSVIITIITMVLIT